MNVTPTEPTSSLALLGFIVWAVFATFGLIALVSGELAVAVVDLSACGVAAGAKLSK